MNFTSSRAVAARIWSRRTCCDASPSPGSPMTRNEKSCPPSIPAGVTEYQLAGPLAFSALNVALTIASRHVSVRASAHEFHMPAAQFSVSKNQLMPNTGTMAAMMAAKGNPICRPRRNAVRRRIPRAPHTNREPQAAVRARRAPASGSSAGPRLLSSRHQCQADRSRPRVSLAKPQVERDDDHEGDHQRHEQVADDRDDR